MRTHPIAVKSSGQFGICCADNGDFLRLSCLAASARYNAFPLSVLAKRMRDLTQGPLRRHLFATAAPIAAGMLFQTLYYLVDLYFVGRLGDDELAGVSTAGNIMFLFMALTQVLTVGTVSLISHASGRKDKAQAGLLFNQSLALSAVFLLITLIAGLLLAPVYMSLVTNDETTTHFGLIYLYWYVPGMALQFALVSMGGALRGTGIVKPTMNIQALSVIVNIILSPVLIAGWGTGKPMGVAGAALASTISILVGVILLALYFVRSERFIRFDPKQWRPRWSVIRSMLTVGIPAGGEFAIMFVLMSVNYWVISGFGVDAQAGFGIGTRIMQFFFLPGMAIAFAVAPIIGQNVGADQKQRVRQTFHLACIQISLIMLFLSALCYWQSERLSAVFSTDAQVIAYSSVFLQIIIWNFITSGLIFTCSGLFQGLGNTLPVLISSATRLLTFMLPSIWMAGQPWFQYQHVWYLSVVTVAFQCLVSLLLARAQLHRLHAGGLRQP